MAKVYCQEKHNKWISKKPAMIGIGTKGLGDEFICSVCRSKRAFINTAKIIAVNLSEKYGFIEGKEENFYFRFSDLAWNYIPYKGMHVSFEIAFLGRGKYQFRAIHIKPIQEVNHDC